MRTKPDPQRIRRAFAVISADPLSRAAGDGLFRRILCQETTRPFGSYE